MTFYAFGAAVVLATFAVVNAMLSFAVMALAPAAMAALDRARALARTRALFALRLAREERMMLEEFGNDYHAYMRRTKRLVPGVW